MNLQKLLETILSQYKTESKKQFKGNKLAGSIRNDFKNCIDKSMLSSSMQLRGSAGQSKWALIPWLAVFDKDITNTAERGFDIVYLFSESMNKVYLSLNQGYTFFAKKYGRKSALKNIQLVSNYFCGNLTLIDKNMIRNIDLLDKSTVNDKHLAKGYEKGNIFAFEYKRDILPSNDKLLDDLRKMLMLYEELKAKLYSVNNIDETVDYILRINDNSSEIKKTKSKFKQIETSNFIKYVSDNLDKVNLVEDNKLTYNTEKANIVKIEKQIDYQAKEKQNSKLGFLGEKIVFEYEKQWVKKHFGTINGVIHVSIDQGDGAGYDIQSKDENGQTLYIEVKTTSGSIAQPFYLSRNELEASKKYGKQFILLRLYNVNKKHKLSFKYYSISGPLDKCSSIHLDPINYQGTLL